MTLSIKKKSLTTTAFIMLFICGIKAQKLPNIQNTGFRAPVNVKVDGKATEWDNQFQAYNKSSQFFYIIANDDDNLYLCIRAIDPLIVDKIITYGVTFDIYKPNTSKKNLISITYPLINIKDLGAIKSSLYNTAITHNADSVNLRQKADSITYAWNYRFAAKSKDIAVTGIESIPDSSVSVYNELGFKAVLLFDTPKSAVYELAIPLKLLGLSISTITPFQYHITLNGAMKSDTNMMVQGDAISRTDGRTTVLQVVKPERLTLTISTDFKGTYTLLRQ